MYLQSKFTKTMASALEMDACTPTAKPLVIFYDCETTGLNTYRDSIVEIGAVVRSSVDLCTDLPEKSFSRLVKVECEIPRISKWLKM